MSNENRAAAEAPGSVLLLGANGFIGALVAARLRRAGWRVIEGRRGPPALEAQRQVDLRRLSTAADWLPLLRGVDAVVNTAGILRERGDNRFDIVHEHAVQALGEACVEVGVKRLVQISALGDPADGEFIASKHRGDAALLDLPLSVAVLRPSVVYSTRGSHGGTSLLRALAALPGGLLLPAGGGQQLQPMAAEDLAELVCEALAGSQRGVFDCGGPEVLRFRDYLLAWRGWLLGRREAHCLSVPRWLVAPAVTLSERWGSGPMNATIWRMLERGNTLAPEAASRTEAAFVHRPWALSERLADQPAQTQDRWHAGLVLLATPLRWATILLWAVSAAAGLLTPAAQIESLVAGTPLAALMPVALARATGLLDLLLALWLASGWRPRAAIALMIVSVLGYTLGFGLLLPALWLDPLGGLIKNLLVLPALAVLWVQSGAR
ncbi:SDR family oxidoreductase [Pseudomarimonas salicorniae]|uniref:SDR family oxidoreductase n=1 Tax=Pseudomarimonas salicorniae TaxID=2933270 RepID=A0ABT0GGX1_9GAMM|nr:SDR family oxidoreductase [Lysobacter sp. CAU 1642]MCK7593698.1 SDR family oxidoreductase [Lysobacter sp. CAU 1642]